MIETVPLHYRDQGAGAPVIILHGLFGSARNWQTIAQKLAASYRVITVDLRNHGDSPHSGAMTYQAMASDVLALMDKLALPAATLIGHSMGGKAAMVVALSAPERWPRLIVVDIAPVDYADRYSALIDAMLALPLRELRSRAEADRLLQKAVPAEDTRRFLLQNLVTRNGEYRWRIDLSALRANLRHVGGFPATTGKYKKPTLFLCGERSPAVQSGHHARILELFPHASFATIPNAGHWPHTDQPDAFLAALRDFLNR
ncbi:MAG: alpha/beta fold hydrolase [Chromatiales bacterium]